jgi:hypothetical protein
LSLQENESRSLQAIIQAFQLMPCGSDSQGDILPAKAIAQGVETLRKQSRASMNCSIKAKVQFVDALETIADGVAETLQDRFR